MLAAALAAGVVPDVVFVADGDAVLDIATEVIVVSNDVLDAIAPTESPRGPIAVIDIPDPHPLEAKQTVVLWNVATPGNVGTLIRTAAALGWSVALHAGADPWSPKVLRAGAGAHFAVPIAEVADLAALRSAGLTPVATAPEGGVEPGAVTVQGPVALLVGSEAAGLPAEIIDQAESVVTMPMRGADSLNAAVAGAIAMFVLGGDAT